MDWLQALILGIIQGLTEFLPVSSSGHLEIGKVILGTELKENIIFTVVVHGATVLSTIIVFWRDIIKLISGLFDFSLNEETIYVGKIALSMLPVALLGVFFKEEVESLFTGNLLFVGLMLFVTALLLGFSNFAISRNRSITFRDALIIGFAQAVAVIPGISRSGATIATSLLLGNKKDEAAKFSFLMVLVPIIGANFVEIISDDFSLVKTETTPLIIGFISAFLTGLFACKIMINIVKRGKLIFFAIYCALAASAAIIFSL